MTPPPSQNSSETAGAQIGRYKLLEQIGEGGMGTIWMAEQREPVKRRVALKIIKLGMDTKQVIARFEAERQALAIMDHPHIAKVLDAGSTETGRPYFVMEYIKGVPILEYCDSERVDTRSRLELFMKVCQAIQHAHQKGIIHRDIKPSNVLVTLHDGVPVPKVIDFGIAKATNSELTTKTLFTEHRQMMGTPAYMSPEQAEMSGLDIDTRSDIYSLGVLLYVLLTGTTPFDTRALLESGYAEMMRAIREDEPEKPSTRVSSLGDTGTRTAQRRRAELKKLRLLLRGDVDWIVMKCLEKDRTRRYETANGLAADIQRHLNDEPVTAAAPSASYKLRKFVKRNRGPVIVACVVTTAVLAGVVGTSWGLVWESRVRSTELKRQMEDQQRTAADNARRGRNAEAVDALLAECEEALRAGESAEANVAMDAARKRAAEGGAENSAERLAKLSADLQLLTELDANDQLRWTWVESALADRSLVAMRAREALRRFGASPEVVSVDDAVRRVDASTIRERIISTMDFLLREGNADAIRAVLRRVDADPFRDEVRDALVVDDKKKLAELGRRSAALDQSPGFAAVLGDTTVIDVHRRVELLEAAALRRPTDVRLLMSLYYCYPQHQKEVADMRIRWAQAAVVADPDNAGAYSNVGAALGDKGQWEEAILWCRKGVELDPRLPFSQNNLGAALANSGRREEAGAVYRKAVELDPANPMSLVNLSTQLHDTGAADEALIYARKAVEVSPMWANTHFVLANALSSTKQSKEAIASYRKAIELNPSFAGAHHNLGVALRQSGRAEEAVEHYRKAVEFNPSRALFHCDLGHILQETEGISDTTFACFKKAVELNPNHYCSNYNLGYEYQVRQKSDEAIAAYRKTIELAPEHAEAHCNLAGCLQNTGHFAEALELYRRGHEIGSKRPDWKYPSAEWVREAEMRVALEAKLPAILAREMQPADNAERLEYAMMCLAKSLDYAAVPLFVEAFAADPQSAEDLDRRLRFGAAVGAVRASTGLAKDSKQLEDRERTRLRRLAIDWLRADLSLHTKRLESGKPGDRATSLQALRSWLNETDLAGVRDKSAIASMPAEDRTALVQLWAEVTTLVEKVQTPAQPPR